MPKRAIVPKPYSQSSAPTRNQNGPTPEPRHSDTQARAQVGSPSAQHPRVVRRSAPVTARSLAQQIRAPPGPAAPRASGQGRYSGSDGHRVSFFESVLADHSKDHAVAVAYSGDTLTAEPYTTLRDQLDRVPADGKAARLMQEDVAWKRATANPGSVAASLAYLAHAQLELGNAATASATAASRHEPRCAGPPAHGRLGSSRPSLGRRT